MIGMRLIGLVLASSLAAGGCAATGAPGASTGTPVATPIPVTPMPAATLASRPPSTISPASPMPSSVAPAGTPHGESVGSSGSGFGYFSFKEFAGQHWDGIALVRIVEVGPVQWSTPDGRAPSDAEFHELRRIAAEQGIESYYIGSLVRVQDAGASRQMGLGDGP
jgi:hypothetical protein